MIPKIIHHTAPADLERWHPVWHPCYNSWKKIYKDFEFCLWSDKELDNIVQNYYPQYLELYKKFPRHIMQIDFARLCVLHKHGGFFVDMDMYCYQNFYEELSSNLYIIEMSNGSLENSLMISDSNNEFWLECMAESQRRLTEDAILNLNMLPTNDKKFVKLVLDITSPGLVTDVSFKLGNIVNKLPWQDYNNNKFFYKTSFRTKHMHTGSWGKEAYDTIAKEHPNESTSFLMNEYYKNFRGVDIRNFDFKKHYGL